MAGKFVIATEVEPEVLDWGRLQWLANPPTTAAKDLTVIGVTLLPGKGHDFHRHPDQEELIYAVEGRIEQWIGEEKRILSPGDAAFIPAGVVHASFNVGEGEGRVVAILGPCVGSVGYEVEEVADQAPWKDLRR